MNKRGVTTIEVLIFLVTGVGATAVWAYTSFTTKSESALRDEHVKSIEERMDKGFERIDGKLDRIYERVK